MYTIKVTFEGHVYNYGKLASVIEDTITITVPDCDVLTIQDEVEKQYGHSYGTFHVHKVERPATGRVVIAPREHKTDINERAVITEALYALIRERSTKLRRSKGNSTTRARNLHAQWEDEIARAQDLLKQFQN